MGADTLEATPGDGDRVLWSLEDLVARNILGHANIRILHSDASARNLVFNILEVMRNVQPIRTRDALSSDECELSKRRQPGTWQFMSAHSQRDPCRPILVEDEMESFFHLLLFYAIRYLPHNCRDVDAFIDQQFNDSTEGMDQDYPGIAKWNSMMDGRFYSIAEPLTFYASPPRGNTTSSSIQEIVSKPHPINSIFSQLLRWIHAHYALANEQKDPPAALSVSTPSSAGGQDKELTEEEKWFIEEYGMDEDDEDDSEDEEEASGIDRLSEEQRAAFMKLAPKLKEHKHFIRLLRRVMSRKNPSQFGAWPRRDKVPDQLRGNSGD